MAAFNHYGSWQRWGPISRGSGCNKACFYASCWGVYKKKVKVQTGCTSKKHWILLLSCRSRVHCSKRMRPHCAVIFSVGKPQFRCLEDMRASWMYVVLLNGRHCIHQRKLWALLQYGAEEQDNQPFQFRDGFEVSNLLDIGKPVEASERLFLMELSLDGWTMRGAGQEVSFSSNWGSNWFGTPCQMAPVVRGNEFHYRKLVHHGLACCSRFHMLDINVAYWDAAMTLPPFGHLHLQARAWNSFVLQNWRPWKVSDPWRPSIQLPGGADWSLLCSSECCKKRTLTTLVTTAG